MAHDVWINISLLHLLKKTHRADMTTPRPRATGKDEIFSGCLQVVLVTLDIRTVLPAKSDSGVMFYLQSKQGLRINRSLVY